jgi:hypothetical protein
VGGFFVGFSVGFLVVAALETFMDTSMRIKKIRACKLVVMAENKALCKLCTVYRVDGM